MKSMFAVMPKKTTKVYNVTNKQAVLGLVCGASLVSRSRGCALTIGTRLCSSHRHDCKSLPNENSLPAFTRPQPTTPAGILPPFTLEKQQAEKPGQFSHTAKPATAHEMGHPRATNWARFPGPFHREMWPPRRSRCSVAWSASGSCGPDGQIMRADHVVLV